MITFKVEYKVFHWDTDHYKEEILNNKFSSLAEAIEFKTLLENLPHKEDQYPHGLCTGLMDKDDSETQELADYLGIWNGGIWKKGIKLIMVTEEIL